ncbi:MAG TPA: alpha/beta fold hydrolase [Solirubrobacteraceae bacterium]|nr:alpha/beta fold hydrolase [Solirubrobacteraceae bacterium]
MNDVARVIEAHRDAGAFFEAAGLRTFARHDGAGENVLLMHGLPASSFLYRKVIAELARRGFRALSFDLPGLGLSARPEGFDYSIRGLGRFAAAAVDALGLQRFHLVVHDAGGPIGFELAERRHDRISSLTILNTLIQPPTIPFPGELMARVADRVPAWGRSPWVWRQLMLRVGILDASGVPAAELDAYRVLALGDDGGSAYLRIMRALGRVDGGPRDYTALVNSATNPYPVQVIWGALDPALPLRRYGMKALAATGLRYLAALPARHFLQEDQAPAVAELIEQLATQHPR